MKDAMHVARLDTLQCQGSNERGAHTTSIFSSKDLNGILLPGICLLRPVQNLTQSLSTTSLEMGVLIEDGAVSSHMTCVITLFFANSCNTACRKTSSSGADELGSPADELKFWSIGINTQLVLEEVGGFRQVLIGVPVKY